MKSWHKIIIIYVFLIISSLLSPIGAFPYLFYEDIGSAFYLSTHLMQIYTLYFIAALAFYLLIKWRWKEKLETFLKYMVLVGFLLILLSLLLYVILWFSEVENKKEVNYGLGALDQLIDNIGEYKVAHGYYPVNITDVINGKNGEGTWTIEHDKTVYEKYGYMKAIYEIEDHAYTISYYPLRNGSSYRLQVYREFTASSGYWVYDNGTVEYSFYD